MDLFHGIGNSLLSLRRTMSDLGKIGIHFSKEGLCPNTIDWSQDVNDFTKREMNRTLKIHEFFLDNLRSFKVTVQTFLHDHHNRLTN